MVADVTRFCSRIVDVSSDISLVKCNHAGCPGTHMCVQLPGAIAQLKQLAAYTTVSTPANTPCEAHIRREEKLKTMVRAQFFTGCTCLCLDRRTWTAHTCFSCCTICAWHNMMHIAEEEAQDALPRLTSVKQAVGSVPCSVFRLRHVAQ